MRVCIKVEVCDVYCGRTCFGHVDCGWGNPFKSGVMGTREQVIEKYRSWLWNRIKTEPTLRFKLMALRGKKLGCWCGMHEACHVDVIERAIVWAWAQRPLPLHNDPKSIGRKVPVDALLHYEVSQFERDRRQYDGFTEV